MHQHTHWQQEAPVSVCWEKNNCQIRVTREANRHWKPRLLRCDRFSVRKETREQTNKIQSTNANDDPHASFSSHPFLHKSVFFIESMCDYLAGVSWWTVPGHSALLKSVSSYAGHQMNNRQHVIQHPVLFGHAICTRKSTRLLVGEPTVSAHTQKLGNKHLARWLLEKSSNDIRDKAQNDREKQFHLVSLGILLHPLRLDKIITFR